MIAIQDAAQTIAALGELLEPYSQRLGICGSVRRGKPAVKDAEILILPNDGLWPALDALVEQGVVTKALYGEAQRPRWGFKHRAVDFDGLRCEIYTADELNWGYQYWLRTGPGDANQLIMTWLKRVNAPVRPIEGYFWHGDRKLRIAEEEHLFQLLGFPWIEPSLRSVDVYQEIIVKRLRNSVDISQFYIPVEHRDFVEEPLVHQDTLFSAPSVNAELVVNQTRAPISRVLEVSAPFDWQYPWRTAENRVWVYVGYGRWMMMEEDEPLARNRHKALFHNAMLREWERKALIHHLAVREAWGSSPALIETREARP